MWESSGLQFFRTTTEIQSGPDVFDKSRLIMTFLTVLGVAEICRFRLVLEGLTGKEIPESSRLEFLEMFSVNNFALLDGPFSCDVRDIQKDIFQGDPPQNLDFK